MKKDFFKDSKIKFPAYEPWISGDDKKIINKTLSQSMLTLGPQSVSYTHLTLPTNREV